MTNDKREALIADPNAGTRALVIQAEDGRELLAIRSDGTVTGEVEDAGEAGARFVAYLREHVFEQAHTPTDDERANKNDLLDFLSKGEAWQAIRGMDAPGLATELDAAGFRRTAVQEPSADEREALHREAASRAEAAYPALNDDDEVLSYPRAALRQHRRGAYITGFTDGALRRPVQGEPTERIEQAIAYIRASWLGTGEPTRNTPAGEIIAILRGDRTYETGENRDGRVH